MIPTEYLASLGCDMNADLAHYGTKRHSGRYPWGSGKRPRQSEKKNQAMHDSKMDKLYKTDREQFIRNAKSRDALRYSGSLSDQELQRILNRIILKSKLSAISVAKPNSKTEALLKKILSYAVTINQIIKQAEGMVNSPYIAMLKNEYDDAVWKEKVSNL